MELNQVNVAILAVSGIVGLGCLIWAIVALIRVMKPMFTSHKRTPFSWKVHRGRRAPVSHEGMTVFLIGMRINRWYRMDLWLPPLLAMSRMLNELQTNSKEFGYYGGEMYGILALFLGYPSVQITYWESIDKVMDFASGKSHRDGLKHYMEAMEHSNGAVGVWHETYEISRAEGMHRDMPEFGLVRAVGSLEAVGALEAARGRLAKIPSTAIDARKILRKTASSVSESRSAKTCPFHAEPV
mmetsp:Transcript_19549/g.36116  ORF Transcript_19549/g.36116 Transcript_19549/m.36116 type:complete len:241 (-) Transcript_19549:23-745(-)|eukprot:CAMPEP_0184509626 /NCGR_PEP_ID=MMETSP0198_2-20121128/1384_1 /TAXON_ID=1112570 /ORGANISM="Thraustochytrium sp., Strain LLF1b" /LENGTH=240 /DNA_ID=CAMNT_0026899469 /DNA_START=581 /DNA_END=1303 /DNA_ORIENTATION=+